MAQQSVRRGRKNQGFPPCNQSTLRVIWIRSANSHTGSQLSSLHQEAGQMAASDKVHMPTRKPLALMGASTDGKRTLDDVEPHIEMAFPSGVSKDFRDSLEQVFQVGV